jgi:predicted XRE-type DNA-binding protein
VEVVVILVRHKQIQEFIQQQQVVQYQVKEIMGVQERMVQVLQVENLAVVEVAMEL